MSLFKKFLLSISFLSVFNSFSQIELAEDMVSWNFTIEQKGDEATIIGKVKVVPHWHINAIKLPKGSFGFPTSIVFSKNANYELIGGVVEPKPIEKYDKYADETLAYHEGTVLFKQKIKIKSEKDFDISGTFSFQTCNDVKCLPDHTTTFKVKAKGIELEKGVTNQDDIESEFVFIENDVAKHKNGSEYVFVEGSWNKVPEGNTAQFYKKYLTIIQKK